MEADKETNAAEPIRLNDFNKAENASALRDALLRRRGRDVVVDGSDIGFLSALSAQALLSARETWRLDGQTFAITAPSDAIRGDLALLGLETLLTDAPQSPPTPTEEAI